MTRMGAADTTHKINPKNCVFCYLSATFLAILVVSITCFLVSNTAELESQNKLAIKSVPKVYVENVEPEDRDLFQFHGFKTSFIPSEEIVLTRKVSNDSKNERLLWKESQERDTKARQKRSRELFYDSDKDDDTDMYKEFSSEEYDSDEHDDMTPQSNDSNHEEIDFDRNHPEINLDRGPLDDVIEQARRQPELEEGEVVSTLLFNRAKSNTVLHAFWKAEGDKNTIRTTQAHTMSQYIDRKTDPCDDFYQHACGNWIVHNPIPADKAGFDTFEMLREYLDTVLKDLLESGKDIATLYPGTRLDIEVKSLQDLIALNNNDKFNKHDKKDNDATSKELKMAHADNLDILNRLRRYLDRKQDKLENSIDDIKKRLHKIVRRKSKLAIAKRLSRKDKLFRNNYKSRKAKNISKRELREDIIPEESIIKQPKQIMTTDSKTPNKVDAVTKARYLYKSCMNYDTLHKRGHQPLLDLLEIFGGWPILNSSWDDSIFNWLDLMAKLRLYNNDILISEWVGPDIKNSDKNIIQFDQTSLGLPSRDYFLQDINKEYLDAYKNYMIDVAQLLGGERDHVIKSAEDMIEFEIKLANITSAPEERKNVSELYQRLTLRKLEMAVPGIHWREYLGIVMNRTVSADETVVMFALTYAKNLVPLVRSTAPRTVANYLLWRFVRHRINNLDDRFQSAKQQFYYVLFGREQSPLRWKSCVTQVNSNMGMAMGSLFVRKYFDENSKNDTLTMTRAIQKAFRELLYQTDWIDHDTKRLAAAKVDSMSLKIGYPDYIMNKEELDERYKEVEMHPDKYFENILIILRHLTYMEQSSLDQTVDKTLWQSAPAVVNAYYSRNRNQIMFPAGILQPPFYHRHFPKSLNFGGIGVVIGHEITHGFDDKGRLFDREGNLHRWWSDAAVDRFHKRAQCLVDQYGRYIVPQVDMPVDGAITQGENIADNGGVKQAFRAYKHWLDESGPEGETLPGLNYTNTQLFFLNFAQVWCGAMRPEALRNKLKTAVHSPGRFRVIGSLSNSEDFAREFNCPVGSPMNPVEKCSVW